MVLQKIQILQLSCNKHLIYNKSNKNQFTSSLRIFIIYIVIFHHYVILSDYFIRKMIDLFLCTITFHALHEIRIFF